METKKTIIVSIITTLATLFVVAVIMHLCCGNCGGQNRCSKGDMKCSSSYMHDDDGGSKCASYSKECMKKCKKMDAKCDKGDMKCEKGDKCCKSKEACKMDKGKTCSKDKEVEVTVTETVKK
ncbi:MAG: hypothetical protein CO118_01350 [Flavobacteriales bacterium CG_4_9_14_3_um_filter_32_8]|nr:MAG: hypothetical protein CO118_01350 [Flavobacteriales bacterium CG_4_9_14_3_um_filter_32_8]